MTEHWDHYDEFMKQRRRRRGELDPACPHPLEKAEATTHTILNCPAEGSPDEEVGAIKCGLCGGSLGQASVGMAGFLLEHVKSLTAEVAALREKKA